MPRVLAVNNYPTEERFAKLQTCLEGNGATVEVVNSKSTTARTFNSFDGVVLSGSPDMLSTKTARAKYAGEMEAVRGCQVPVLGVCFGHQLLAAAFGARIRKVGHVLRFVNTDQVASDPLFAGLRSPISLLESRDEVVGRIPEEFVLTARSETTEIAGMRHMGRQLYGVQSHPERFTSENPDGNAVIGNFVRLLGR